jgi:tricarballylate dehydrogenase
MVDMTRKFDVLVIGGGNAALCAAIGARRAGASVLVLEGAPKFYRGGNTRHTRNMRCAHDAATDILTGPYSEAEFWDDLLQLTGGQTDEELAKFMIRESKDILGWIVDQGVRWQPSLGGTLSLGRTNSFFLGGGRAMLNALYLTAEKLGVDILYDAEVLDLDIDNGMFLSATLKQGDGRVSVRASTMVAAAGGFEANIEWLREYWGEAADNFLIRGTPYNRGSILKMLLAKGVQDVGDPSQCHAVAIDARAPKFDGGIITRHDSVVFGIVVNKHAKRFYDEGEDIWPKRYAIWWPPSPTRSPTSFSTPARATVSCRRCSRRSRPAASALSPPSSNSIRPRWKKPSPTSTPRCGPAPSTTPSSTIAAPKA